MVVGRLDERKRRKDFILERNLLYPSPFEKELSQEEKELCRRYDVYMRFNSKEDHEELLKTVVSEHRLFKRIQELKVCCSVITNSFASFPQWKNILEIYKTSVLMYSFVS